jgi:signal transduction histidine kinase
MPTSSEFFALCQSQVALLTQGLGAALSIVYLTEEFNATTDTQLIPVVAYPEAALNWGEEQIVSFLKQVGKLPSQRLLSSESSLSAADAAPQSSSISALPSEAYSETYPKTYAVQPADVLLPQQQMVLPLIYQEQVMGLLVTARADRAWSETEQAQIDQIAKTITAACVLDWRARWLAQDLQRQQLLEEQRNDLLDDLLHQFRNPLTALKTFGKLLVKRLRPGDANRSVAESIVRESDRLQDLLKQLDTAIDFDSEALLPLLNAQPEPILTSTLAPTPIPTRAPASLRDAEIRLLLGSAIELQPHAIADVLQPLLESATVIAQDRRLTLWAEVPPSLPPVLMDMRALREVLNNLIDNALKYTPAGGQISISVQRQVGQQQTGTAPRQGIVIADSGPGIPPQDLQHLFERHYRGVQATTDIPGTGLGLAIARDLVQRMQGEIQMFSPAAESGLIPKLPKQQPDPNHPGTAAVVWLVESAS